MPVGVGSKKSDGDENEDVGAVYRCDATQRSPLIPTIT